MYELKSVVVLKKKGNSVISHLMFMHYYLVRKQGFDCVTNHKQLIAKLCDRLAINRGYRPAYSGRSQLWVSINWACCIIFHGHVGLVVLLCVRNIDL